jgi:hypothetical protein
MLAAEPSDNPCRSDIDDVAGRVDSKAGLVRGTAPASGSDTRRLFPLLDSTLGLERRILPVVLTAHVPADANGIEPDFRGVLEGEVSRDWFGSSSAV